MQFSNTSWKPEVLANSSQANTMTASAVTPNASVCRKKHATELDQASSMVDMTETKIKMLN